METVIKKFDELTLDELYGILKARAAIFVVEQSCAYQDLDGKDKEAYHVFLRDSDGIAAYLRVLPAGMVCETPVIGRVITVKRGIGLGSVLLRAGVEVAKERLGAKCITISAQSYAIGFYEKGGFRVVSDEYLEDGIPHVRMIRDL